MDNNLLSQTESAMFPSNGAEPEIRDVVIKVFDAVTGYVLDSTEGVFKKMVLRDAINLARPTLEKVFTNFTDENLKQGITQLRDIVVDVADAVLNKDGSAIQNFVTAAFESGLKHATKSLPGQEILNVYDALVEGENIGDKGASKPAQATTEQTAVQLNGN